MDPLAAEIQALYEACQSINSTNLENVIFKETASKLSH